MLQSNERFRITYRLTCEPAEDPYAKARDLALEQTVEVPAEVLPPAIAELVVGRVEVVEPVEEGGAAEGGASTWRAVIAYEAEVTVGDDVTQFVNLLFGNASLKAGILVEDADIPATLLMRCGGPRFGIPGVRGLCGVEDARPLLCAAAKPLGLSPADLANICYAFAAGGVDIVKDDHGLADQAPAPFAERVPRCQEAVARANADTGGRTLYFPHVSAGANLDAQLELARAAGCRGIVVSPLLVGWETTRRLAEESGLVIFAHPALAGAFFHPTHGIRPDVLLGRLFRTVGCDGVIYPNVGGRFTFSLEDCEAINRRLREPYGVLRPAFPVAAGGIAADRVPEWLDRYGPDTVFLLGSSLYRQRDLRGAAARLVEAVRRRTTVER
jgi:ribulose-bisphosphate carboxylase large chain